MELTPELQSQFPYLINIYASRLGDCQLLPEGSPNQFSGYQKFERCPQIRWRKVRESTIVEIAAKVDDCTSCPHSRS